MMRSPTFSGLFALSTLLSSAAALPQSDLLPRASTCAGNTATTRSEWCDWSIDTDYYETGPDTGVTREYWLTVSDVTVAPDGHSRQAIAVNGSIPGPTLYADWGDTVKVHITNNMTSSYNGTSVHFHGIRQNRTSDQDGVNSITQCPIALGNTITQTWKASAYGSTWYHSHFALQAWEGVFGGIIINGPATKNYDEDLGIMFLNDWSYQTVDELWDYVEVNGPATLDTGLINGTNVGESGGHRWNTTVESGTTYRLRLVNAAIDTHFKFSLDNHTMTVIATDLVPVEPFEVDWVSIGMGQRYDVLITMDQAAVADKFWLRAIPQAACSENDNSDDIRGIVYYNNGNSASSNSTTYPSTSAYTYTDNCLDINATDIVPYVKKTVGAAGNSTTEVATVVTDDEELIHWELNSTDFEVEWAYPTLEQVVDGVNSFNTSNAVYELNKADQWVYMAITTTLGVPHPIHLHGHDFYVLAQGTGTYSSSVTLNKANPPRRDTAMLPSAGYVVIAFQADNPGAWLMHCHIGWHTSEGFALQFVERKSEIAATVDATALKDNCDAWVSYASEQSVTQDDDGI